MRKRICSVVLFAACTKLAPAFAVTAASIVSVGCLFSSPGPSNVGQGQPYTSGDQTFDLYFAELFQTQVAMGEAPNRDQTIHKNLADAVGVPPESTNASLAEAVGKRAQLLAKLGVTTKLALSGLEEGGTPTAVLTSTGSSSDEKDRAFVATLDQATKDAAKLLGDIRLAKPTIERLRAQTNALEPSLDETFRKGGPRKKAEVEKNLEDAGRLIPLMANRADEMSRSLSELLAMLGKAVGTTPALSSGPPPTPVKLSETPSKPMKEKGHEKKGGGHGESKPGETGESAPKEAKPAESKPAEPKQHGKPPASDDFEP